MSSTWTTRRRYEHQACELVVVKHADSPFCLFDLRDLLALPQIQEIRRLISSTSDPERRASLEEQLRELELASVQVDQSDAAGLLAKDARDQRRKSFRPMSAKPRMMLTALTEVRAE